MVTWKRTVPIVPARDIEASAAFYRDELGFEVVHTEAEYGIVRRGDVELHLWGPSGIDPRRSDTMLRVEVEDIDALHADLAPRGLVHPNAELHDTTWGTREFAIRDVDGHLITFFAG